MPPLPSAKPWGSRGRRLDDDDDDDPEAEDLIMLA